MIPERLVVSNFLSYGEAPQSLDFTRFHIACLSGSNGHGKSALLDAITYALWGQGRKGRHDRKADDGLLRLGARQMRVEFTFRLDDGCYRVIRSYRKRPKSSATELELQIEDPATAVYRPLSEAGAVGRTQARIDRLLSMDYETFVNSAYLVQGRADAFTRKGPRERKELLAQVLGLSRYDDLQEAARRRLQAAQLQLERIRRRIQELDVELEAGPELEAALGETEETLQSVGARLAVAEQARAANQERWRRAHALKEEQGRCQSDLSACDDRLHRLEADRVRLQTRRQGDGHLLSAAAQIEKQAAEHDALREEAGVLQDHLDDVRRLEAQAVDLRRQIDTARNEVAQRRATWLARRQGLDERLRHFDEVLADADAIEAAWLMLTRDRDRLRAAREQHSRAESLRREGARFQHEIDLVAQDLRARIGSLDQSLAELRSSLRRGPELEAERKAAEAELASAEVQGQRLQQLHEEGTHLRARIEQTEARTREIDTERGELIQRVEALGQGELTECPLCGTALDAGHRQRIDEEFEAESQALLGRRDQLHRELEAMRSELEACRERYREISESAEELPDHQQRVAALREEARQLEATGGRERRLTTERESMAEGLEGQAFATEARARLLRVEAELSTFDVEPGELATMEERVETSTAAEARHQLLCGAREERVTTEARHRQALGELSSAESELEQEVFAGDARAGLDRVRDELGAIGFDEARHRAVRERLEALSEAPALRERLQAARERERGDAEDLLRLQEEQREAGARRQHLEDRRDSLGAELAGLSDAEATDQRLQAEAADLRSQRDELLQQRGSLQARRERLRALAAERESLSAGDAEHTREAWLYTQLVEAFGKDGIQALVIESAIPEIEEEANDILRRLTDNRIQVAIDSLRDLKKGGSRETLDVKIADELGERSYDLYSGGEAFRTDFALRIALSKVLARRAGTRLRTLIIDEGFGTQDSRGLEQLTEAIQQVGADFDKVLVVTHLEEMKSAFPVQIEVTKELDRGSRFQIIE